MYAAATGRHFIVEMQMQNMPLFNPRVVMNACRIYGRQARLGSDLFRIWGASKPSMIYNTMWLEIYMQVNSSCVPGDSNLDT
jgi:hypothetical protein